LTSYPQIIILVPSGLMGNRVKHERGGVMNRNRTVNIFYLLTSLLVGIQAIAGCGPGQLFGPSFTDTPTSTLTPVPTLTITPTSTFTPTPTFTPSPIPTPTIVPEVGVPISNDESEITLISPFSRKRIFRGDVYYTANPGYIFIDLGLKVKNLDTTANSFQSSDVLVLDDTKEQWSILWIGRQPVKNDRVIDPFSISVDESFVNTFSVENEVYFRFIFVVSETSSSLSFQFDGIPLIPFTAEQR
jgi:hypothetical protein